MTKCGVDVPDDGAGRRPTVTVAIPTYRRPDWLRVAIECALAQTFTDIEILVSDSDRSDEIAALVAGFGDERLRYRRSDQPTNGLENALAMYSDCRGELIATLHDDDMWDPRYLEVMVAPLLADPSVQLTFADHWVMDAAGQLLQEETEAFTRERGRQGMPAGRVQPFVREALVLRAVFFVVATVFRAGLVDWDAVPPEVAPPYEVWLTYLASRGGAAAWYIPERLSSYRVHGESAAHSTRLEVPAVWTYDQVLADPTLSDLHPEILRASAPFRSSLGWSLLVEGETGSARVHLRRAWTAGARLDAAAGLIMSVLPQRVRVVAIHRLRAVRARRRLDHRRDTQETT